MNCPYCGKEMKAGGIPSGRSAVYWQENSEEIDAPQEKVILSKNPVWGIEECQQDDELAFIGNLFVGNRGELCLSE